MSDRAAKSLDVLLHEVNDRWPNRDKRSDGGIGDKAHQMRKSDHNPVNGVFHARDITHDPVSGPRGKNLANALAASRDARIDYMISDREIMYGMHGVHPWQWGPYHGVNPHNHHMHISVVDTPNLADSERTWDLSAYVDEPAQPHEVVPHFPTLSNSAEGDAVKVLQNKLNVHGAGLKVDGKFGGATEAAVRTFQKVQGIKVDGIVGPYTWDKLE